ncbi:fibronectin type III domain-containing protein, partial [Corallococcus exiguus]|uniref:fibronectin type III domain-containing protein n=1 Tax=Corallococcus exiguus TaxID=83462 RepID=UPI001C60E200
MQLNWGAVSGAGGYEVQYRRAGASSWTSAGGVGNGWQLATVDESVFVFRVRATNTLGAGAWSATATGYVRPQILPVFVSQSVPTDVRAGMGFSASQVWRNNGYTS